MQWKIERSCFARHIGISAVDGDRVSGLVVPAAEIRRIRDRRASAKAGLHDELEHEGVLYAMQVGLERVHGWEVDRSCHSRDVERTGGIGCDAEAFVLFGACEVRRIIQAARWGESADEYVGLAEISGKLHAGYRKIARPCRARDRRAALRVDSDGFSFVLAGATEKGRIRESRCVGRELGDEPVLRREAADRLSRELSLKWIGGREIG